jgi:hypothetical protein
MRILPSFVDYAALAGKRVAILGGGASAFDNAATALEAGVAQAHVFIRRPHLPRINPIRFMERVGLMPRYPALDDATKYEVMASFFVRNQPPTTDMFDRAASFDGFALHTGSPWEAVEECGDCVRITTPKGSFDYDFLMLSTGLITDPALRPELAQVADTISRWSDHYAAPAPIASAVLDAHPYLGPAFQFTARTPADAPRLHGLFAFNYSALISLGLSASALSGLKHALPRLVNRGGRPAFPRRQGCHPGRLSRLRRDRVPVRLDAAGARGGGVSGLTTHVLDTAHGRPAAGLASACSARAY